jgi:hypothetical protein
MLTSIPPFLLYNENILESYTNLIIVSVIKVITI